MKTMVQVNKKWFSNKYTIKVFVDCDCKDMAEAIELSVIQMLASIKAYDFAAGEHLEETAENYDNKKIGFHVNAIGTDDGIEPFEDEQDE